MKYRYNDRCTMSCHRQEMASLGVNVGGKLLVAGEDRQVHDRGYRGEDASRVTKDNKDYCSVMLTWWDYLTTGLEIRS